MKQNNFAYHSVLLEKHFTLCTKVVFVWMHCNVVCVATRALYSCFITTIYTQYNFFANISTHGDFLLAYLNYTILVIL